MVVDPVTSGVNPCLSSEAPFRMSPPSSISTLSILKESGERRKSFLFSLIKRKLRLFWLWFLSLMARKPREKKWAYFEIIDGEKGHKYRLVDQGKGTQNIVKMGEKAIYLNELSFPNPRAFKDLPQMLKQIMEREKIDVIQTKSLSIAKRLWECGLKTDTLWTLRIPCSNPLSHLFCRVINKALEKRQALKQKERCALEQVEEKLVMDVVTDAFQADVSLETFFQHKIAQLESIFPQVDLQKASERLAKKAELPTVRAMISDFQEEILFASSHQLSLVTTADLPISQLFTLAAAVDIAIDRGLSMSLNHLVIFKKEKK